MSYINSSCNHLGFFFLSFSQKGILNSQCPYSALRWPWSKSSNNGPFKVERIYNNCLINPSPPIPWTQIFIVSPQVQDSMIKRTTEDCKMLFLCLDAPDPNYFTEHRTVTFCNHSFYRVFAFIRVFINSYQLLWKSGPSTNSPFSLSKK